MSKDAPYIVEVQGVETQKIGFHTHRGFITFYRRLRGDTAHFTFVSLAGRTATFSQYSSVFGGSGKARSEASTEARKAANRLYVLVTRKVSLTGENPCSK